MKQYSRYSFMIMFNIQHGILRSCVHTVSDSVEIAVSTNKSAETQYLTQFTSGVLSDRYANHEKNWIFDLNNTIQVRYDTPLIITKRFCDVRIIPNMEDMLITLDLDAFSSAAFSSNGSLRDIKTTAIRSTQLNQIQHKWLKVLTHQLYDAFRSFIN